jgi:putative radical SAM enzyme (TIGR03279 family)
MIKNGLKAICVEKGMPAFECGIRKGDIILSVDDEIIDNEIVFKFQTAKPVSKIKILRNGQVLTLILKRNYGLPLGIELSESKIKRCPNHCIFCFVDQMPKGLRKSLYVKDEDVYHSFMNGNYVTLAGFSYKKLQKICKLKLSPIYISVHCTNSKIRSLLLGNKKIPDIMKQLKYLENNRICFHTQIVVCPPYNSGNVLKETIKDLLKFKKGLISVAIVPVGITKYNKNCLTPVNKEEALKIYRIVNQISDKDNQLALRRRVFLSDELFLIAGLKIPPRNYYENYPQIENGVGLIRKLLDEWKVIKKEGEINKIILTYTKKTNSLKCLIITSESAYPFINKIVFEINRILQKDIFTCLPIKNDFFGGNVCVAGLITAIDIIKQVKKTKKNYSKIILPSVLLNNKGYTIDGYSIKRIQKELDMHVFAANSIKEVLNIAFGST